MKRSSLFLFFIIFQVLIIAVPGYSKDKGRRQQKKLERKSRDKYLGLGLGFSYMKVIDNATSPLLYKGLNIPFASLGYFTHSDRIIKTFETDFSYGQLKTRTETPWYDPRNTSYYIAFRYDILYRIKKFEKLSVNWYLGSEINSNSHFRINYKYENSAFNFDNYNGIGIATRLELPFTYKSTQFKFLGLYFKRRDRDLRLSWQLSSPVLSLMIRPTYVTITNFIDPELQTKITSDNTDGGLFVPFNLRSQTELHYKLHNGNMFRLTYIWNYYHHDPGYNKVQSAFHGFYFSLVFRFNK
jgi:hypothetical protein